MIPFPQSFKKFDLNSHLDHIKTSEVTITEIYTLTQAKAKFSEIINRIIYNKDTILITKKGKKVAAIVSIDKLNLGKEKGLIAARNVLSEIDEEIDAMVDTIYKTRNEEISREVSF